MKPLCKIVSDVPASGIRKFFDVVSQMKDVVSLGVGEPDFVTPWRVREAAIYSLERGYTNYTSNYGLLELRTAIAEHVNAREGLQYNPENQILITVGVSEGMDLALRAILNPGDEVIVPEPCYVSYKPCVVFAGGVPIPLCSDPSTGFATTADRVAKSITPNTKAILLSYPCNPTGATMSAEELQKIVDVVAENDLYIITDEIYDRLTYSGRHCCVATLKQAYDRTILLNGFSKAYAMTGWRIAYAASRPDIIEMMMKIHQYTMLCASIMGQMAALEAIKNGDGDTEDMVAQYDQRRRLIVSGLNQIGLPCVLPNGAFYAFPSIESTGLSSEEFSERLLFEEKVAVVPGNAFGDCGEGFVRCSYATSIDKIETALERIEKFVKKLS
ncbi:MAG: aminotransferase class I/II-fold pyridoxal phosphate-dependent enzyme [Armatimonadota bacterium]|nr:aminotransferase class I/II-fold pyridoxal phosphate-dependent enzyme [Armatimonadota bacterium]